MKLQTNMPSRGGAHVTMPNFPWYVVYPFFLVHMAAFGGSGFQMAYGDSVANVPFLAMHGGIAIYVYIKFYLFIFGKEEVKWMFINAALGSLGIFSQMNWILRLAYGTEISNYPVYLHIIPFIYFVLYTFLLRQALLELTGAKRDAARKKWVDRSYVGVSLAFYLGTLVWAM